MKKSLLIIALLLLSSAPASAISLNRDTTWQGEKRWDETVRVEPGATLTIRSGSRVNFSAGQLEIAGRLIAEDVLFSGSDWGGIVLKGCDAQTIIRNCRVEGAKTGIFAGGGTPRIETTTVRNNDVGIELKQQSAATIKDCRITDNRKVGLFIKDESTPMVSGCTLSKNGKYGAYIYRALPQRFANNTFGENETALIISNAGSDPLIEKNVFTNNKVAILVDRAARPQLRSNTLQENQTAIRLYRRADAEISSNLFQKNHEAINISYSSYPTISDNSFVANGRALFLEFQSSSWEKSKGASVRENEAASRGAFGQSTGHAASAEERRRPDAELTGLIDARNNWWGEEGSDELARIGAAGNPSFIDDGRDTPTFVDAGQMWPLDQVTFSPWRTTPNSRHKESL